MTGTLLPKAVVPPVGRWAETPGRRSKGDLTPGAFNVNGCRDGDSGAGGVVWGDAEEEEVDVYGVDLWAWLTLRLGEQPPSGCGDEGLLPVDVDEHVDEVL